MLTGRSLDVTAVISMIFPDSLVLFFAIVNVTINDARHPQRVAMIPRLPVNEPSKRGRCFFLIKVGLIDGVAPLSILKYSGHHTDTGRTSR